MDEQLDWRRMLRKLEFASVAAIAVTLLFVIIGQSAEQLAGSGSLAPALGDKVKPQFNAIDYASTGSTAKAPVIIGPCATRQP